MRWLFLAVALAAPVSLASPRAFPLAWDSVTLAPGANEGQLWVAPHVTRADRYTRFDNRLGVMVGIAEHVEMMAAIDVNLEFTGLPGLENKKIDAMLTSLWHVTFHDRGTDGLGISAIGRGSIGLDIAQLEARLILDKELGNTLIAVNSAISRDFLWSGRTGMDLRLEQNIAVRYNVGDGFAAGLEFQARSAFDDKKYQGTAVYVGPSFTLSVKKLWFSVGFYAQVYVDKAKEDHDNGQLLDFKDNEHFSLRFMAGFLP